MTAATVHTYYYYYNKKNIKCYQAPIKKTGVKLANERTVIDIALWGRANAVQRSEHILLNANCESIITTWDFE